MRLHFYLSLLCILLLGNEASGQKEDYVWYFGHAGVGLDFSFCTPTVIMDGDPDGTAFEGVTSVSDATTGEILFYTTGYKAYNSSNQPMPNGDPVGLSNSLAQTIIVPWPGFPDKYFLVIPEVQAGVSWMPLDPAAFSLYYAVIDMSLDGGLGDVSSKFNVLLTTPHCEFLTAVPHANDTDFWLIGHEFNSDAFFTYAVTSSGIASVPTFQTVGPVVETPQSGPPNSSHLDAVGSMRASPDGTHLAFTTLYNGITNVFDFDASSGSISQPMQLTIPGGAYGISFSPNGSKLYVSVRDTVTSSDFQDGALVQFDLSSGDQSMVQASLTILHQCVGDAGFATLKLGPDGRLYVRRVGSDDSSSDGSYLGVVRRPDLPGMSCDYIHEGIWLNGTAGGWGLNNSIEYGHQCGNIQAVPELECNEFDFNAQNGFQTAAWTCPHAFSRLSVTAIDGRQILDEPIQSGLNAISWKMPDTASGIYFATLVGSEGRVTRSFFVAQ